VKKRGVVARRGNGTASKVCKRETTVEKEKGSTRRMVFATEKKTTSRKSKEKSWSRNLKERLSQAPQKDEGENFFPRPKKQKGSTKFPKEEKKKQTSEKIKWGFMKDG